MVCREGKGMGLGLISSVEIQSATILRSLCFLMLKLKKKKGKNIGTHKHARPARAGETDSPLPLHTPEGTQQCCVINGTLS